MHLRTLEVVMERWEDYWGLGIRSQYDTRRTLQKMFENVGDRAASVTRRCDELVMAQFNGGQRVAASGPMTCYRPW